MEDARESSLARMASSLRFSEVEEFVGRVARAFEENSDRAETGRIAH